MATFGLYVRYALRSFVRGRSRSLFGAFCVAVGIASVVALGLVGGNFRDAVSGNAQKMNRGDVSISFNGQGITPREYRYFATLKAQHQITGYTAEQLSDAIIKSGARGANDTQVGSTISVEGRTFPFYDTIKADVPAGVPLKQLLRGPRDAVVSHTIYDRLHLHIGSTVRTIFRFGGSHTFTVRGIVPDNAPDAGFGGGLFPFWVIVDRSAMADYRAANNVTANSVYMTTSTPAQAAHVKTLLDRRFGPLVGAKTVADVEKDSKNGADGMNKFFRIMGLVAVIIGGIGIINTMLVATRRRLKEIAILKAVGMKGRQVVTVFVIESFFLGLAGTLIGIVLGIGTSAIVNRITEGMAGYAIPWSLHVGPIVAGLAVGIVATVLFAYLPVVRASRARPVAALRDAMDGGAAVGRFRRYVSRGDSVSFPILARRTAAFPFVTVGQAAVTVARSVTKPVRTARSVWASKGLRTFLLVLALTWLLGYLGVLYAGIAGGFQTVITGAIAGFGVLIGAGVLIQVFVLIVWMVSKFPSFGRLSARLALRNMGTQKRRLGSTLLALTVGILSIGSIVILAQSIKHELATSLEKRNNYNVAIQVQHDPKVLAGINAAVTHLGSDVRHQYAGAGANLATLTAVDGHPVSALFTRALAMRSKDGSAKYSKDSLSQLVQEIRGVDGQDLSKNGENYLMSSGRNLGPQDVGTNHIVVSQDISGPLGVHLGSRLTYQDGGRRYTFTVVGLVDSSNFNVFSNNLIDLRYMQKVGLTSPAPSHLAMVLLDIPHGTHYQADLTALRRASPGGFVLDLDSFLQFVNVIDKLVLFPEIIAALSLFAGAIIIANTVALAMMERRREIGVMKAIGATRSTILKMLFVENAIVGFVGAGVGVLLAMLASYLVNKNMLHFGTAYDWPTVLALIGLGIVLAIAASSLTALPASSEKPMRVLRYE